MSEGWIQDPSALHEVLLPERPPAGIPQSPPMPPTLKPLVGVILVSSQGTQGTEPRPPRADTREGRWSKDAAIGSEGMTAAAGA